MATRQTRRVAATWARKVAFAGWSPNIPAEALTFFKEAYSVDTEDGMALSDAKDSVGVFLPKILDLLRKAQGDRYYVNASEAKGRLFYFFSPRQPVDAFNLTLGVKNGKAFLAFGYIPYKLNGMLDIPNMLSEKAVTDPEVAGLSVMRLVRSILSKV